MKISGESPLEPFQKVGKAFAKARITKAKRDKAVKMAQSGRKHAQGAFKFTKRQALRGSKLFGTQIGSAMSQEEAKRNREGLKNQLGEAGLW